MTFMTYLFNRFFIETRDTDSARPSFSVTEFQLKNRIYFFLSARPDVSDFFICAYIHCVIHLSFFAFVLLGEHTTYDVILPELVRL